MYESREHGLLAWPAFLLGLVGVGVGVIGYHLIAGLAWIDAFLNASMILSGMGPVDRLDSPQAKLFAAFYALFSGLMFVGVMGIMLAPWLHRLFHKFHLDDSDAN